MALARGIYGIEYNPRQAERDPSGVGWIFVAVGVVAFVSLAWTLWHRFRSADPPEEPKEAVVAALPAPSAGEPSAGTGPETDVMPRTDVSVRPVRVRNLLMRLETAERAHDIEMAVTTIETLRSLPGSPAADLDDALARRLGTLNMRLLFVLRSPLWVKTAVAKRGMSLARLASEYGSTRASLLRLNGLSSDTARPGKPLYVMNHPRFNLVIHRRLRTADLSLNGKFFKRYDLERSVTGREGAYRLPKAPAELWSRLGLSWRAADRSELEMLLPAETQVLVSEL